MDMNEFVLEDEGHETDFYDKECRYEKLCGSLQTAMRWLPENSSISTAQCKAYHTIFKHQQTLLDHSVRLSSLNSLWKLAVMSAMSSSSQHCTVHHKSDDEHCI